MSDVLSRAARFALTMAALWAVAALALPAIMSRYAAYPVAGPRALCAQTSSCGRSIASVYQQPLASVIGDATLRSLALLAAAAVLAIVIGILVGASLALLRRRAWRSGVAIGVVSMVAAIPSFFVAYFLQMLVIFLGGAVGHRVLPVFGFGLNEHAILPTISVALPAVAITTQIAAARFSEVLDADFVRTAEAKGLWTGWILRAHVLPHVLPLALEAVGSGLRVSVASLPVVEWLFVWNGIGFIALQAVGAKDADALVASALVLAGLFTATSLLLDVPRRR